MTRRFPASEHRSLLPAGWDHARARAVLVALTEPGGGVVIPSPVYPPFFMITEESGRRVVPAALTSEHRLDPDAIDRAIRLLIAYARTIVQDDLTTISLAVEPRLRKRANREET